jgi:alkylated DNA repair dioxygenase AlkB
MAVADLLNDAPDGLSYRPEFLSHEEESTLLAELETLRFDPIVMHGQAAKRTGRHFGLDYDYERRVPQPGEPLPSWLEGLREKAAGIVELDAAELAEILVQHYPVGSTIGWHRDAPAFHLVVGVSLGGSCRMRLRSVADPKRIAELTLEPRSAYVLRGSVRWAWQHSIPPTKEERYSVTFRSLRDERPASGRRGRAAEAPSP